MFYTSRSAIETRKDCSRKRYLNYHYKGKGIVPSYRSIPLTTGICVHSGIEFLVRYWKENPKFEKDFDTIHPELIDKAVWVSVKKYEEELKEKGFTNIQEKEQEFTKNEQLALTEALVRAWGMREFSLLVKNYRVLEVEKEMGEVWSYGFTNPGTPPYNSSYQEITFQGKADIILESLDSNKDVFIYSLKTIKEFGWMAERSYKQDLQGSTETYLTNRYLKERNKEIENALSLTPEWATPVRKFYEKAKSNSNSSGVKFCYLIKGNRKESDFEPGHFITYNPLIRGYKKVTGGGIEWSHSWFYPNSENKSGKGTLGKGWEPFNVWESEYWGGSVKKWMEALDRGEIQKECPDAIKGQVVTPIEVRRDLKEIEEDIESIRNEEIEFFSKLTSDELAPQGYKVIFGKSRKRCMYPTPCDYYKICYGEDERGVSCEELVQIDPVGSGEFEERKPHHSEGLE